MLTIEKAIDYATDRGCVVGDTYIAKHSKLKAFEVFKRGDDRNFSVIVTQRYKGARLYKVNGENHNHANAIVTAVNTLTQHEVNK